MECALADSLEIFVADDAFEGGAFGERRLFDNCELIGQGNALKGETVLECPFTNSFEVFVADDELQGGAIGKCPHFDDFEIMGESDTLEGVAPSK